ncbi:hypothetical protein [Pleionea sediminis]|uniref:hypothetical protein n=1 Tax=Pleionea sediminis TaxID=2569479 RepID=UPI001186054E|nr:hypothetical protein [Pleionea sediminis]
MLKHKLLIVVLSLSILMACSGGGSDSKEVISEEKAWEDIVGIWHYTNTDGSIKERVFLAIEKGEAAKLAFNTIYSCYERFDYPLDHELNRTFAMEFRFIDYENYLGALDYVDYDSSAFIAEVEWPEFGVLALDIGEVWSEDTELYWRSEGFEINGDFYEYKEKTVSTYVKSSHLTTVTLPGCR